MVHKKIISFFRYPGGKSKLRTKITTQLTSQIKHNNNIQYREPFFGGGSIGLKFLSDNPNITKIWINDKDIGIACLWTAVIKYPNDFKEFVHSFQPSVSSFYELQNELININIMPKQRTKIVDIGFKKLAIHQISYSGLGTKSGGPLGGLKQKSQYKINCRWSPNYICNKIDNLQNQFKNIEFYENKCTNLDFQDVIKNTNCNSLLYLDPPYYVKGNVLYQHSFTVEDHERLAQTLKNTNHAWILSYDDCQEIRKMYKWAYIESLKVNYSITALKNKETGKCLARTKSELLIYPNK
jgi:DNA adenine methylase